MALMVRKEPYNNMKRTGYFLRRNNEPKPGQVRQGAYHVANEKRIYAIEARRYAKRHPDVPINAETPNNADE